MHFIKNKLDKIKGKTKMMLIHDTDVQQTEDTFSKESFKILEEDFSGEGYIGGLSPLLTTLNINLSIDNRVWEEDIKVSRVYAKSLEIARVLSMKEHVNVMNGFNLITKEWQNGLFKYKKGDVSVHDANARRLNEVIGIEIGNKIHAGKCKMEQSITNLRMWLRKAIVEMNNGLKELIEVICRRAEDEIDVVMPGYNNMKRVQPVRWSHWLLSYAWFFNEDFQRLLQNVKRVNVLPLGCGTLAGNALNVNRQQMMDELKFEKLCPNSMTAVGDRDFVVEFLFWASLTSVHFSRLAEDLIIFSTIEFNYVTLSDEHITKSKYIYQKRNPSHLERLRGKVGLITSNYVSFLTILKGLPGTFNQDLEEEKRLLFETYDCMSKMIKSSKHIIASLHLNINACLMESHLREPYADFQNYLLSKGVVHDQSVNVLKEAILLADQESCSIHALSITQLESLCSLIKEDIYDALRPEVSANMTLIPGGTSEKSVHDQILELRKIHNIKKS